MERLNFAVSTGVASGLLETPLTHSALLSLGFDFMGYCWDWSNKPYHQIETELGTLCVVDYQDVYMVRGNREDRLAKITNVNQLKQFISLLDLS